MATRYLTGVPELDDALTGYLDEHAPPGHADLIREMIGTTLKLIRDQTGRGDLKIINSALKEMRYSFKVLRPYNRVRKVSVFGSARTSE